MTTPGTAELATDPAPATPLSSATGPTTDVIDGNTTLELTITALAAVLPLLRGLSSRSGREPRSQVTDITMVPSTAS